MGKAGTVATVAMGSMFLLAGLVAPAALGVFLFVGLLVLVRLFFALPGRAGDIRQWFENASDDKRALALRILAAPFVAFGFYYIYHVATLLLPLVGVKI